MILGFSSCVRGNLNRLVSVGSMKLSVAPLSIRAWTCPCQSLVFNLTVAFTDFCFCKNTSLENITHITAIWLGSTENPHHSSSFLEPILLKMRLKGPLSDRAPRGLQWREWDWGESSQSTAVYIHRRTIDKEERTQTQWKTQHRVPWL